VKKKIYVDELIEHAIGRGETVVSIAEKLGISESLVSRYRRRKKDTISVGLKKRVATVFKVGIDVVDVRASQAVSSSSSIKNARQLLELVDNLPHAIVRKFFMMWERRYGGKAP